MSAATMRMTRTMMLEVLRQDFIRTAWSKGLKEQAVVLRHAVKNALIPIVTLVGLQLPIVIGGSVIMENVFNLPGLGFLMVSALTRPRLHGRLRTEPGFRHGGGGGQSRRRSALWLSGSQGPLPVVNMAAFFVRMWKEKSLGAISGIIILILILVAIFADALAPYDYLEMHLTDRLTGSSARYLLGTDQMGRDLLSRLIHGARLSLTVGLAATALNVVVATLIGGTSGFLGSRVDLVVQRLVDAWMAIPGLLVLLTIMSIVGGVCHSLLWSWG